MEDCSECGWKDCHRKDCPSGLKDRIKELENEVSSLQREGEFLAKNLVLLEDDAYSRYCKYEKILKACKSLYGHWKEVHKCLKNADFCIDNLRVDIEDMRPLQDKVFALENVRKNATNHVEWHNWGDASDDDDCLSELELALKNYAEKFDLDFIEVSENNE